MSALRRPCDCGSGQCNACDDDGTVPAVVVRDPTGELTLTTILVALGLTRRPSTRGFGRYDYVTERGEVVFTGTAFGVTDWLRDSGHYEGPEVRL